MASLDLVAAKVIRRDASLGNVAANVIALETRLGTDDVGMFPFPRCFCNEINVYLGYGLKGAMDDVTRPGAYIGGCFSPGTSSQSFFGWVLKSSTADLD